MMTLANYGIKSNKYKDPVSAKSLSKSLQIRNRAEASLKQCLKTSQTLTGAKRQEILEVTEDYYNRVPFDVVIWNKAQVKQCVVDSILSLDYKFNPYRALNAFQILETMLLNLHNLPWHREFTKIVTYSGRFRQDVSGPLFGAENVLRAAGFEQETGECPMHLVLPAQRMPSMDGAEHVTQVIFDCLLAQVIMSDIVNVLESSCKSSKVGAHQLATSSEVNCYLWIQSYFRERCHQVTDKACSSIQELLNNITNYLSKQRASSIKVTSGLENPTEAKLSLNRIGETSQTARKEINDCSSLAQRQENVRRLLAQGPLEDKSLLRLSDDLLKLPDERSVEQDMAYFDGEAVQDRDGDGKSSYQERLSQHARSVPRSAGFDDIDSLGARQGTSEEQDYGHPGHPTRVDLPHNDRELLIPKRDRKNTHEQANESRQPVRNLNPPYGNRLPSFTHSDTMRGSPSNHLVGKHHYEDCPPIRDQHTRQTTQISAKNPSSRYDQAASHGKYQTQNVDRPPFGRMHWSCRVCTFYNHEANDVCEMCGLKRLL